MSAPRLQQANALLSLSRNSTRIAGVALAGLLVATVGAGWALALDGATYALGAVFVGMLKLPPVKPLADRKFLRELAEGWHEFRSRSWLCVTIVQFALINAYAIGAFLVLGPFVAEKELGGAAAWGFILAAEAVGMILAGIVALRYKPERPLLVATLAVLTMAPLLALLGMAAPLMLILPAALLAGVGLELLRRLLGHDSPAAHPRREALTGQLVRRTRLIRPDSGRRRGHGPDLGRDRGRQHADRRRARRRRRDGRRHLRPRRPQPQATRSPGVA